MKRYFVFAMEQWEAAGGMHDFVDDFDVKKKALEFATTYNEKLGETRGRPECKEMQVYDQKKREIILEIS